MYLIVLSYDGYEKDENDMFIGPCGIEQEQSEASGEKTGVQTLNVNKEYTYGHKAKGRGWKPVYCVEKVYSVC